jgi:hypothetical protein
MPSLDGKMKAISENVLKRPLTDAEELELLRISEAMGMSNVQSFLYLLLVFKLHEDTMHKQFKELSELEDRLNGKFGEMSGLYAKIDEKLRDSIGKILGEDARRIGRDMGVSVAEGAKEVLGANREYHFLRGQVWIICLMSLAASLSYWLGSANVISGGGMGPLEILLLLPSGWLSVICSSLYAYMWAWDHWELVKNSRRHKLIFAAQIFLIFCLAAFLVSG